MHNSTFNTIASCLPNNWDLWSPREKSDGITIDLRDIWRREWVEENTHTVIHWMTNLNVKILNFCVKSMKVPWISSPDTIHLEPGL